MSNHEKYKHIFSQSDKFMQSTIGGNSYKQTLDQLKLSIIKFLNEMSCCRIEMMGVYTEYMPVNKKTFLTKLRNNYEIMFNNIRQTKNIFGISATESIWEKIERINNNNISTIEKLDAHINYNYVPIIRKI